MNGVYAWGRCVASLEGTRARRARRRRRNRRDLSRSGAVITSRGDYSQFRISRRRRMYRAYLKVRTYCMTFYIEGESFLFNKNKKFCDRFSSGKTSVRPKRNRPQRACADARETRRRPERASGSRIRTEHDLGDLRRASRKVVPADRDGCGVRRPPRCRATSRRSNAIPRRSSGRPGIARRDVHERTVRVARDRRVRGARRADLR